MVTKVKTHDTDKTLDDARNLLYDNEDYEMKCDKKLYSYVITYLYYQL